MCISSTKEICCNTLCGRTLKVLSYPIRQTEIKPWGENVQRIDEEICRNTMSGFPSEAVLSNTTTNLPGITNNLGDLPHHRFEDCLKRPKLGI